MRDPHLVKHKRTGCYFIIAFRKPACRRITEHRFCGVFIPGAVDLDRDIFEIIIHSTADKDTVYDILCHMICLYLFIILRQDTFQSRHSVTADLPHRFLLCTVDQAAADRSQCRKQNTGQYNRQCYQKTHFTVGFQFAKRKAANYIAIIYISHSTHRP